jgi:hypothetical protein
MPRYTGWRTAVHHQQMLASKNESTPTREAERPKSREKHANKKIEAHKKTNVNRSSSNHQYQWCHACE